MGLLTVLLALGSAVRETVKEKADVAQAEAARKNYESIDFNNIAQVVLNGTETAYRTEEEEEFDIVQSNFLTEQCGFPHYETKTVQYEVENGVNYCFTIKYKNGKTIYRSFHETSPLAERLLELAKKKTSPCEDRVVARFKEIINDSLNLLSTTVNPETYFSRYKIALENANRILANTNHQPSVNYALAVINDLTQNKTKKYIEFIDRCHKAKRLYFHKDALLSDAYDLPPEVKKHIEALLCEEPTATGRRFAVVDFETTGLNYDFRKPPMDEIISVSIIDQDGEVLLDTYCNTVKIKSWYEAQRVHGISPRDVKGKPTFVELMPKVVEILSSFDYVIAYNLPFEKSFLEGYSFLYTPTDFSIHKIKWGNDPMYMFMQRMNSRKFLKLEAAAEHFGYSYNAHSSLEDARATLFVYNAMIKK